MSFSLLLPVIQDDGCRRGGAVAIHAGGGEFDPFRPELVFLSHLPQAVHLRPDVRSRLASLVLGIRHFWREGLLFHNPAGRGKTVTVSEDDSSFTLDNGILTAQVAKRSGDLVSLKYRRLELLKAGSGHPFGYWSHDASRGERTTRITIDPKTNDGAFGEVSVKSRS